MNSFSLSGVQSKIINLKSKINKVVYFVSGIDTDAGKSVVTGLLARSLRKRGVNVITQKFIQTGGSEYRRIF